MKKSIWFFTFILFSLYGKAIIFSPTDSLLAEIDSINILLTVYDSSKPFNGNNQQLLHTDLVQQNIIQKLLVVLNNNLICLFGLDTLFQKHSLLINSSADKNVYFITMDEKVGGIYKTAITIIHYKLGNGNVKAHLFNSNNITELHSYYVNNIHNLNKNKLVYYLESMASTCNTCVDFYAMQLSITSCCVLVEPIYHYTGNYYNLNKAEFNPKDNTFSYEELLEKEEKIIINDSTTQNVKVKITNTGKFKFIQNQFYEMEHCKNLKDFGAVLKK